MSERRIVDPVELTAAIKVIHEQEREIARIRAENEALREMVKELEDVIKGHRRLTRDMDVALNGTDGAAQQASLCDLIGQVKNMRAENEALKRDYTPAEIDAAVERAKRAYWDSEDRWRAVARAVLQVEE